MIVLISGKQGSGKTTIQRALAEAMFVRFNVDTLAVNFADIIYRMHDAVLEILNEYWPERDLVKDGPLLQVLGTEWGRNTIDPNIWVKCLQNKIKKTSPGSLVVIGDSRFENEFSSFPGALRVRLECPRDVRAKRCSMWRDNDLHPSEIALDEFANFGMFDLYLDTDLTPIHGCVDLIIAQLQKNNWLEKRHEVLT